jgi:hypothetical protein
MMMEMESVCFFLFPRGLISIVSLVGVQAGRQQRSQVPRAKSSYAKKEMKAKSIQIRNISNTDDLTKVIMTSKTSYRRRNSRNTTTTNRAIVPPLPS